MQGRRVHIHRQKSVYVRIWMKEIHSLQDDSSWAQKSEVTEKNLNSSLAQKEKEEQGNT